MSDAAVAGMAAVLSGAKTQPTSADMQRIHQALGHPQLSWERVTQRACAHGIAPSRCTTRYSTWA